MYGILHSGIIIFVDLKVSAVAYIFGDLSHEATVTGNLEANNCYDAIMTTSEA